MKMILLCRYLGLPFTNDGFTLQKGWELNPSDLMIFTICTCPLWLHSKDQTGMPLNAVDGLQAKSFNVYINIHFATSDNG